MYERYESTITPDYNREREMIARRTDAMSSLLPRIDTWEDDFHAGIFHIDESSIQR